MTRFGIKKKSTVLMLIKERFVCTSCFLLCLFFTACRGDVKQQPVEYDHRTVVQNDVDYFELGFDYLEENSRKMGVKTLPSGLQYEVLSVGTGRKPGKSDYVRCHYEGRLVDGILFDSSVKRGEPVVFAVKDVIRGWMEALLLMKEGAKWRITIPYHLGYGELGVDGRIPPFSTLVFEVELLEVL